MQYPRVASIVEGHGECDSVPILVSRVGKSLEPAVYPDPLPPIRKSKCALLHTPGELEKAVTYAVSTVSGRGGIFTL